MIRKKAAQAAFFRIREEGEAMTNITSPRHSPGLSPLQSYMGDTQTERRGVTLL
jgi:hypothetical protein